MTSPKRLREMRLIYNRPFNSLICCPTGTRSRVTKYFTRFALKILSTLDPGSATSTRFARLVYRLRLSRPCGSGTKLKPQHYVLRLNFCMLTVMVASLCSETPQHRLRSLLLLVRGVSVSSVFL
jgi:hypothetical protein